MAAIQSFLEQRHRTQPNNFFDIYPTLERGRKRLGQLLGCAPECIEYAPNTSYALNVLAMGYPWQRGDRIAIPSCEFPANVQPWLSLRERFGVEVDFIPTDEGTFTPEDVEQTLRPETRLLAVSWVQFLSGFRCDLKTLADLAHANGSLIAVDAIQGLGALRLNAEDAGIDFLASGGQKWMLATQGSAFIYVAESLQEQLMPIRGWLNGPVDWDDFGAFPEELHPDARRFRVGTLNSIGCIALDASVGLHLEAGPDWIEDRVLSNAISITRAFEKLGLKRFGSSDAAHASGIVTVDVPDPEGLNTQLIANNIHGSVRDRKLRLSPHAYNTEEEIERTIEICRRHLALSVA